MPPKKKINRVKTTVKRKPVRTTRKQNGSGKLRNMLRTISNALVPAAMMNIPAIAAEVKRRDDAIFRDITFPRMTMDELSTKLVQEIQEAIPRDALYTQHIEDIVTSLLKKERYKTLLEHLKRQFNTRRTSDISFQLLQLHLNPDV